MIQFSVFKSANGRPLGKCYSYRDGELKCRTQMFSHGTVRREKADSLAEFAKFYNALELDEIVSFGVCKPLEAKVVPKAQLANHSNDPSVIARTSTEFFWSDGPGVLALDFDPLPDEEGLPPEELVALVRRLVPELSAVAIAHKASSSSHLKTTEGKVLSGIRGQHLLMTVTDARIIPQLGKTINQRAWLDGLGKFHATQSGRLLEKGLLDASVWKPEHLFFHHAHCGDGIVQDLPGLRIFPGTQDVEMGEGRIDQISLPTLSSDELAQLDEIKRDALERARPIARQNRDRFISKRLNGYHGPETGCEDLRRRFVEALEEDRLPIDFELRTVDGENVRVANLLERPYFWDGKRFADPLEPSYRDDCRIAVAELLGGRRPSIYSHAHGGKRYWLTDTRVSGPDDFEDLTERLKEPNWCPVLSAADFARGAAPDWLVKGLLPKRCLAMIYGPSGSGKTFLALDLVWAIVTGKPWRGLRTAKGKVVYVAAEGRAGFRKRLQAKAIHTGPELEGLDLGVVEEGVDFRAGRGSELAAWVSDWGGADLIVVDTLAQVVAGADENSGEDMGPVIQRCNAITAATGATVLLVHHAGKDINRGARGWSGIRAAMDAEIQVSRQDNWFTAKVTKQKDGEEGQSYPFKLTSVDLGNDDDGDAITSCVVHHFEDTPFRARGARGKWQKLVLEEAELQCQFGPIEELALVDSCRSAGRELSIPGSRAEGRQPELIRRAIKSLVQDGVLVCGNGVIGLPPPTSEPQFDDLRCGSDLPPTPHLFKECGGARSELGGMDE